MRPLKLAMTAFLAYKEREEIDFNKLGNERIFVISGKTGAGKSTIFDAISFALFGTANLSDRDSTSLRSDFASGSELTSVELTFKIHDQIYWIKRSPKQVVPKARGEGMRSIPHKVELYEVKQGEKKLLASSVQEAEQQLKDIIQLSVDQFRQILMIPQGEFRELLVSDSKKKEQILQRLAHTVYYKRVEERLIEKQKELEEKAGHAEAELVKILERVELNDSSKTLAENLAQLEIKERELDLAHLDAEQALKVAHQKAEGALQQVTHAENTLVDFKELETSKTNDQMLNEKQDEMAANALKLKQARKAEPLRGMREQLLRFDEKLKQENERKMQLKEQLQTLKLGQAELVTKQAELQKESEHAEKWRHNLFQFEELEPKLKQLETKKQEFFKAQQAFEKIERHFQEKEEVFRKLSMETEQLARKIETKTAVQNAKYELLMEQNIAEKELSTLNEKVKQAEAIQTWQNQQQKVLAELEINQQREKEQAHVVEEKLKAVQKEQAAVLAMQLVDGEACPVCGALDHPHPADFHEVSDEAEALEAEQAKLESLKKMSQKLEEQNRQLLWQMDQGEKLDLEELTNWQKRAEELQMLLKDQEQEKQKIELASEEKARLTEENAKKLQQKERVSEELSALQIERESKERIRYATETEIRLLENDIPEKLQSEETFFAMKNKIKLALDRFLENEKKIQEDLNERNEQVVSAETELKNQYAYVDKLKEEQTQEVARLQEELLNRQFADIVSLEEALLSEREQEALEAQVKAYEDERLVVKERIVQLERKLKEIEKPDLEQIQAVFEVAKLERSEKEKAMMESRENKRFISEQRQAFIEVQSELNQIAADYADVGLLADTTHGKNELRLTFERYVLATFLDTIIYHANARLAKMTSGRFELKRKLDRAKGNAQSGLELEVFDAYTGASRHVKTLSGGESFKTSLALALALAEVVQEMAGGVSLDTMFIDEGFGTLDPESLEMAIECLIETQENGRLVGIISHVPELKERIPARLEVTATNDGSKTKFFGIE